MNALLEIDDGGVCEIFQVDESVFVGKDHIRRAYSHQGAPIRLELDGKIEQQSAKVIGAMSNKGTYYYWVSKKYFLKEDILWFVKFLEKKNKKKDWAIFWDHCRTHTADIVQDYIGEKAIPQIMNVKYSPEYNGIEQLWAYQKQMFRKTMTEKKVKKEYVDVMQTVINIQKHC